MTNKDEQTKQNPIKHNLEDKPNHEVKSEMDEKEPTVDEKEPLDSEREVELPGAEENVPVQERGPRAGQETEERRNTEETERTERDPTTENKKSEIY